MKRSKFTEEQIIGILREQEAGAKTAELCRRHGISSATFYAWKAKFGGMDVSGREAAEGARGGERPSEAAPGGVAARPGCIEGSPVAKVVTPAARREAVAILVEHHEMSERRACTRDRRGPDLDPLPQPTPPDDRDLRERLRALASERRRFGYRRLHVLLRREGHVVNRKKTQRLYREEGLTVRKRRGRKKATGTRAPLLTVTRPNARWSVDFRPRSVRPRSAVPDLQRDRRCHEGMPGRRGRHLDLGPPRRAGN